MSHQVALTLRAPIKQGQAAGLERLLASMSADSAHSPVIPFARLPGTHFARLLTVDDGDTPCLLLLLDCDAPAEQRLRELVAVAGKGLDELLRHCEGYPTAGRMTAEQRLGYLRSRLTSVDVFYVHAVGRTLQQIRQEAQLRQAIGAFLDRAGHDWQGFDALKIREVIRAFVQSEPTLVWAGTPAAPLELSFRLREALRQYGTLLLLLGLAPALIPALLVWAVALRLHERRDPAPLVPLDPARLRALSDGEDVGVQNAISTLAAIKPGRFWRLTATLLLGIASYGSRHIFNRGSLAGLTTVHFARFMRLDNGARVLFTSYYDGSLESYMNDFIDQVSSVLNLAFGDQSGYPRTRWLALDGATDEAGFKTFLRGHQIPTQVWYSAYDQLAAVNIDNNARIRAGLYGVMSLAQAQEWLRRL